MRFRWTLPQTWKSALICALATVFLGMMCLLIAPVRFWFERWSYDLPFLFAPSLPPSDVIVVKLDETSYRKLQQDADKLWDRSLPARLLNEHLTPDEARLVVFDVFFSDPGDAEKNKELAEAMRRNGHVVLAMGFQEYSEINGGEPIYPQPEFKDAARAVGVVSPVADRADGVVRQIYPGREDYPSLAWNAAAQAGLPKSVLTTRLQTARWLNYPASLDGIRQMSFWDALHQQPGYFTNKIVFIGGSPEIKMEGQSADLFVTPSARWGGAPQPGVMIQALTFLNLIQQNWLEQISPVLQLLLVLGLGVLAAVTLSLLRPWLGALCAVAFLVILFAGACALVFGAHQWFPWTIVAGAEVPFALGWSVILQSRKLAREKELVVSELALERQAVERLLPPTETDAPTIRSDAGVTGEEPTLTQGSIVPTMAVPQSAALGGRWIPPSVPDHTLIRCIGEGAYGQVWLARDVLGNHHAVKFVYRKTFESATPFEREFNGIHHFTPISRMHPGFMHILHVGRNESVGYFFYIMELGDDESAGQKINPTTYTPKTLGRLIRKQRHLPARDCVKLGLDLSSALEYLLRRHLIHRDIKPSNVLYVHDQPKFADVGLVTQIDTRRTEATYIGTEGYIAPEGPGTAAADVYSLGKVLYEACMGLDRMRFPDLPTTVVNHTNPLLPRFNEIILKACEFNPRDRYKSAQELHDDLQALAAE